MVLSPAGRRLWRHIQWTCASGFCTRMGMPILDADFVIAAQYEVSRAWVHRLIQRRRETGSLMPR